MAGWSFAPPGIFGLAGHQLSSAGPSSPRLSSKKRPTARAQRLQQQRRLEKSVRNEWIVPEPVIEPEVENVPEDRASPSSAKEEEEEDMNDPQNLDWRRDPSKPVMRSDMGSNMTARARWQVAFAKVLEMTSSVRKRQHRVALGLKVKEYLMFHHLRGTCGRMTRSVDSFERSVFSDKTEKMEITYEAFSEGVVPEAENWVRKNFEEMREVLEPVVQNEQFRKYDMNELERMLRMKEQEDAWLDAQQHSTDELLQTHGKLMERSVSSLADMVRQVLSALAAEIAGGLQRHRNLRDEYDSAEHESFDMSQKQKKLMTQIEEFEARQKEAKDGYDKEVETLRQEFMKVRRATTSVKFQLAKDNSYCDRLMEEIENAMAKQMAENAKVMAEEHIKRIKRKWDVHQREKIMRQATYQKELRELREKLAKRQADLEERRAFLEVSLCRSKTSQAKLLLFELQARTQEMEKAAPAQRKKIKRLFSSNSLSIPKPEQGGGLLLLLGEELQLQRQWLTERGQHLEVDAKSFEIRGPPLLGTPTSLISKMWDIINEYRDPSRSLQRIFREELLEAKALARGEELEQMTMQLFDGQQVQQAVEKALTSLEATRRSEQSLAVRWAEVSSSVEHTEVHDALTEKLEELNQGLTLAEASKRWFREPDQNTAQHLAGLTSKEELAWLGDLSKSLGSRCGQLRASTKVLEACQGGDTGSMQAVERLLGDLPTLLDEDVLKTGQHFAARMKRLLAKRQALQDELLETWSRRMSVHEEQSHAECVSEGLGSLIYLLEDSELKETPQEEVTPAELLNILHSTAARVFKHRKSEVFDWAMMGLSDMDHMVTEAVTSEQAGQAPDEDVQVAVSQLEVDSKDLLQDERRNFDLDLIQQRMLESLEPPNDLLQSMEELVAAMDSSTIHLASDNVKELQAVRPESEEVLKPSPASRPGSSPAPIGTSSALLGILEADAGDQVLNAVQVAGIDIAPSRPSTGRQPSSQLQPAGRTSVDLIDEVPSAPAVVGDPRELVQSQAEGLREAIDAPLSRPPSSTNQPQPTSPTPAVTSPLAVEMDVAEDVVEDVATDVTPMPVPTHVEPEATRRQSSEFLPSPTISPTSSQILKPEPATVEELDIGQDNQPREGQELETPTVVLPKTKTPEGDNVKGPTASKVFPQIEQSAVADSDRRPSDNVPVPIATAGETSQQASHPLAPGVVPTAVVADSRVSSASNALRVEEELGARESDGKDAFPFVSTELGPVAPKPIDNGLPSPSSPKEAVRSLQTQHPETTDEPKLQISASNNLSTESSITASTSPKSPSNKFHIERESSPEPTDLHTRHIASVGSRHPKEIADPVSDVPAEVDVDTEALAALVSASFSRRVADQPSPTSPTSPTSRTGPATVSLDFANVVQGARHVNSMQQIRANSGLSALSATATPKAKGRRRRPRAMTRLGKEFDVDEPEEADSPFGDDRNDDEDVEVEAATEAPGLDFRGKLEAILAKSLKAKGGDWDKDVRERLAEMNETEVSDIATVLQPEVLELQQALMQQLQKELEQVSEQMVEVDDAAEDQVSQQQELRKRATALQEHLQAVSHSLSGEGDNLLLMVLAEMAGDEETAAAFARKAISETDLEPPSVGSPSGEAQRSLLTKILTQLPRSPQRRVTSPTSPPSPTSPTSPKSPKQPSLVSASSASRLQPQIEEPEEEQGLRMEEDDNDTSRENKIKSLRGLRSRSWHPNEEEMETGPLQVGMGEEEKAQAKLVATMKLQKPQPWERKGQVAEEAPDISLAGVATGPKKDVVPGGGSPVMYSDDAPVISERRRSSFDVIDTGVLVAIGRNRRELEKEDGPMEEEEYFQSPNPAWVESWIQSAEDNFLTKQSQRGPSGNKRHQETVFPSSSTEQPMVSILSLQAEGEGASSKGNPRGLKGSMPRRGAPKFVREKAKKSSGRPEENALMDWGTNAKTVSNQEEPGEDAKDPEQRRPEVPEIPDEAPAEWADVEMPIATNEALVDDIKDERPNSGVSSGPAVEEALRDPDRPNSGVSSGPAVEEVLPAVSNRQERDDSDHAVLSRHPSKNAVGKLYRQKSKGSKMDMLLHSRSFRSSTSLNLSEPDESGNNVETDEMDVEINVDEAERKRETAAHRWKLGGLAIQAVLRLRETIHSPNPPGSRRNSFNRSKVLVQREEPVVPVLPVALGKGEGPGSTSTDAAPVAVPDVETRDVIVAPKLPQVQPAQAVGQEDVSAFLRRTSITPRAQGSMMKQMQVTVPSVGLVNTTAATPTATPRLPPAPAPPKTAVRQNGVGDRTAKSSLDRGDNLTLTAATIQAVRSLDAPYLGGFGKSEQRLLSAHTQLSHDDSHLTLSKDSAYSSAGFSPYTSQTELHKMSSTNLSYQSSVAKFSIDSREKAELKEENVEVIEALQEPTNSVLPLLDRRSYGVETALLTPTGKLLGSPGCWNGGLSKEVGEIYMAHAGHVLEMRSLPHLPGKFKAKPVKAVKAPAASKLVLTHLAKPKKKRQLIQATTPTAGAGGARREPVRPALYTRGHRLNPEGEG